MNRIEISSSKMSAQRQSNKPMTTQCLLIALCTLTQYNLMNNVDFVRALEPAPHMLLSSGANKEASIKHHLAPAASSQSLPKLPKINIYLSKSETQRLLGVDTPINYVSNGTINTYPFKFQIPLGYNQNEMVFTWQNLGQTNVNYTINFEYSNVDALERPRINITQRGLIPKHEQVWRLTVPCTGKVGDEVDVDIFIDISGFVPIEESLLDSSLLSSSSRAADDDDEDAPRPAATTGGDDPSTTAATTGTNSNSTTAANEMQSDQEAPPSDLQQQQPRIVMRPVAHRFNIRRKKICTKHPVPVYPHPTYPPTQPVPRPVLPPTNQQPPSGNNAAAAKWPPTDQVVTTQTTRSAATNEPIQASSTALEAQPSPLLPYQPAPRPPFANISPTEAASANHHKYPTEWPPFPKQAPTIPAENPLNDLLIRQQQQQQHNQHPSQSFMVPVLALLSVVISLALIVVVLLLLAGGGGSSSNSFLLNKLNALKSCRLIRRRTKGGSPASHLQARANSGKSLPHGSVINSLRAGLKSSAASSVSGLSAISGHSHLTGKPAYCYKSGSGNSYAAGYYYGQQQQQQSYASYPHPPTADLLGTGYQCQQQQPPQYPIYHIETTTANPAQTTRLIWQNGNGTSPDGFIMDGSYLPLSNHQTPRSDDTGSACYQTIY